MANLFDLLPSVTGAGAKDFTPGQKPFAVDIQPMYSNSQDISNKVGQSITPQLSSITDTLANSQMGLQTFGGQSLNDLPFGDFLSESDVLNNIDLSGSATTTQFKVRLVSVVGLQTAFEPGDINSVIFEVTPTFSESGSVEYSPVQPIHMPGSIQTYKFTQSRTFSITAHFISRNTADALRNMKYLQTLRSWRYPYFGNSSTTSATKPAADSVGQYNGSTPEDRIRNSTSESHNELLGAPPEVLYLYAYSTSNNDKRGLDPNSRVNINRVPVVMSSLTINYPEDVDYIPVSTSPTSKTEPFPVKLEVQITLLEAHSPSEYEKFNLASYKTGNLSNF